MSAVNLRLLAEIERVLAMADAAQEHQVALWLDHARIAAGGSGQIVAQDAQGRPVFRGISPDPA